MGSPVSDEHEVSGLDIADQIAAIWDTAKRGETPAEHAVKGLGEMISEFARRGGRLDAIAYSLGLLRWDDPEDRDDPPS